MRFPTNAGNKHWFWAISSPFLSLKLNSITISATLGNQKILTIKKYEKEKKRIRAERRRRRGKGNGGLAISFILCPHDLHQSTRKWRMSAMPHKHREEGVTIFFAACYMVDLPSAVWKYEGSVCWWRVGQRYWWWCTGGWSWPETGDDKYHCGQRWNKGKLNIYRD